MSPLPTDRAEARLLRALAVVIGPFTTIAMRSVPWSSATFEGARHRLALRLEGSDGIAHAERLCMTLVETELPMRGAFVADLVVTTRLDGDTPMLGIEALTIAEAEPPAVLSRAARRAG